MTNGLIAFTTCLCAGVFLALIFLNTATGCGRPDGSCIVISDFME